MRQSSYEAPKVLFPLVLHLTKALFSITQTQVYVSSFNFLFLISNSKLFFFCHLKDSVLFRSPVHSPMTLKKNLFEIIIDSVTVARNNTKRCHIPFNHFVPMVTSCKTIIQHHSQDTDGH